MSEIILGDCLKVLQAMPAESVDCVVTSPPYWGLRDYGHGEQLGLEPHFNQYIENLCAVFDEVRRVLKKTGTCWVNLGDSYVGGKGASSGIFEKQRDGARDSMHLPAHYTGKKGYVRPLDRRDLGVRPKSLVQIPARFAIAMIDRGWILRNEVIWQKPNAMPQSIKDRFSVDYEKLYFFTKSKTYYFEQQFEKLSESTLNDHRTIAGLFTDKRPDRDFVGQASRGGGMLKPNEQGRNKRSVWSIATKPGTEAHFAVYPVELVMPPIKAGCPEGGVVLDPFFGTGTTGVAAKKLGRRYVGIEVNPKYVDIAERRLAQRVLL